MANFLSVTPPSSQTGCLSVPPSVFFSVCYSLSVNLHPSIPSSAHLYIISCQSVLPYICLPTNLPLSLCSFILCVHSSCVFIHTSLHALPACLSLVCQSVCLSVCLSLQGSLRFDKSSKSCIDFFRSPLIS